jgi:phospholipase C
VIVVSQGKRSFDNYFGTFPGANGFPNNLSIPLNPFTPPLLKFTVATWFNTNDTFRSNAYLVNKGGIGLDSQGNNMNYGIWLNRSGNIIAGFESVNGVDYTVSSNSKFNDGKWHHAVVTYDGNSELKLFMDGKFSARNHTQETPDTTGIQPIRIGSNSLQPRNFFTGFIDEVRIWNKTLDNSEVLSGYVNNTFNEEGQFVYLSFDDEENKSANASEFKPVGPKGIYLNGSSFKDVNIDTSQYTNYVKPFHLENTKTVAPYHGSKAYLISYNNGLMNGFLQAQVLNGQDGSQVIGYYNNTELPYYWELASEFVLADNFFAPTMNTGLINDQYLYTGTSENYVETSSIPHYFNFNRTIFDNLEDTGLSWRIYVNDYVAGKNYTDENVKDRFVNYLTSMPRFVENKSFSSNVVDLVEYYRDLRDDEFPAVAYIMAPSFEESSPRDVSEGQGFATSLILALMKSKHWNDSIFIITYRESGGWYDHVKPPIINGQMHGFRVPTLIISPFAKEGYVDRTLYDAASILKLIEDNYSLPSLNKNDANANNMSNAFDFTKPPRKPLLYNVSFVQNVQQESENKIISTENVIKVYYLYLIVIASISMIGFIIWRYAYLRKAKLDLIKDKSL